MAGRGARSDRGDVRGALVDEFTHVITGGTTRNCVLKQSSTVLGRCRALCRGREAGRRGHRLFRALPGTARLVIGTQPVLGRELAVRQNGYVWRRTSLPKSPAACCTAVPLAPLVSSPAVLIAPPRVAYQMTVTPLPFLGITRLCRPQTRRGRAFRERRSRHRAGSAAGPDDRADAHRPHASQRRGREPG
jgi:hypothetical protein